MTSAREPRREPLGLRLLAALSGRLGGALVLGAAEIMVARTGQLRRVARLPKAFSVRPTKASDETSLGAFMADPAKAARLLASGDVGLLATDGDGIQAMEWARLGPAEYEWDERRLGVVFKIPARGCWLHNGSSGESGAVGPWAMIMRWLPGFLEERSIEVSFLQVACDNVYSIQCHESLGFRKVARIVTVRVGKARLACLRLEGRPWTRLRSPSLDLERLPV
jgi:hypothetical protein